MKKIQVIGNLTKDCVVRQVDGGRMAINFTVAENERWKDKQGQKMEKVTYFSCTLWRSEETSIAQYLTKGVKIFVEGSPSIYLYENQEQQKVGIIQITVRQIELLDSKKTSAPTTPQGSTKQPANESGYNDTLVPTPDDDIPF